MTEERPGHRPLHQHHWWVPVVLVALVGIVYANALPNPFQYDDRTYIVENEDVRTWPRPLKYLRPPVTDSAGRLRAFYRPVTMLSFYASFRLTGEAAAGFRVVDLLLHAAAVLLLFVLTRRLLRRLARDGRFPAGGVLPAAALAGAVLAVHPLTSQTLNEISKRDTLLAAVAMLGALQAYLTALTRLERAAAAVSDTEARGSGGGARRGWLPWLVLGGALQALALGSKEVAVSLPLLLLLCHRLFAGPRGGVAAPRRGAAPVVVHVVAWALSGALVLTLLVWLAGDNLPRHTLEGPLAPSWQYALGQPLVILRYLRLMVSPAGLSALHEVTTVSHPGSLSFVLPTLALGALAGGAVLLRRRLPEVTLAVLGGLGHLVSTSLLRNPVAMDEDRVYLVVGLAGVAGAALLARAADLLARRHGARWHRAVMAAGLVAILSLGVTTILRNRDWSTRERLWRAALEVYPTSRSGLLYLADVLAAQGREGERVAVLAAAVRHHPRDLRARLFFAHALAKAGQSHRALAISQELLHEDPGHPEVVTLAGHLRRAQGKLEEAAALYARAMRLDPGAVTPLVYLADCRDRLGAGAEARRLVARVPPHHRLSPGERAIVARLRGEGP